MDFQKQLVLKSKPYLFLLFLLALLSQSTPSSAQFVVFAPTHRNPVNSLALSRPHDRQAANGSIPFWDDFSQGIDAFKWITEGSSYTETIGTNAPSIGMVLFNGVDELGRSYSLQEKDQGESDFLTSIPLDLSSLDVVEQTSLYLSFFWQAGGKAEVPDRSDRLTLQILTPSGNWQTVWEKSGGDGLDRSLFTQ